MKDLVEVLRANGVDQAPVHVNKSWVAHYQVLISHRSVEWVLFAVLLIDGRVFTVVLVNVVDLV